MSYYCTNGVATMFGGLIGYAIGHITTGIARWMYVFIIFGGCSLACGLASLFLLPDLPATAKFLSEPERAIAVERVAANRQGVKNHVFKRYQALQTFRDPKTWILFVMAVGAQIPNSALTSFTSIIVGSFGFDTLGTQYLQIPGGAVQFFSLLIGGYLCTKQPNRRCITMITANSICIIGAGLLVGLPQHIKWGRLVALWLCFFQGLGFSMSLTMVSSNVAGFTKKQLTGAVLFTGYCVGNIIGTRMRNFADRVNVWNRATDFQGQRSSALSVGIHCYACWLRNQACDGSGIILSHVFGQQTARSRRLCRNRRGAQSRCRSGHGKSALSFP